MRLTDKMKDDERHIIQRILRGETALYEHFLNTYGQQVFILVARRTDPGCLPESLPASLVFQGHQFFFDVDLFDCI